MGEVVQFHGARHSGRTWRQLQALPDGSIFLVPNEKLASYCRNQLRRMGRQPRSIRFATPENFRYYTGAVVPAADVDHAYWDCTRGSCRAHEAWDFIQLCVKP